MCQCIGPGSELTVLLVNTIIRDLTSKNALEVAAGLNVLPSVVDEELAPSVLAALNQCLAHQKVEIRIIIIILIQMLY